MKKVGEISRRTSLWTALAAVLALALPAVAGAQFMDPVLEQYAPSTEQIAEKVKAGSDKKDKGDGQTEGETQADQGSAVEGTAQGDAGDDSDGNAVAGVPGGGGGSGGDAGGGGAGGGGTGDGAAGPSDSGDAGLGTRLLGGVPVTKFDLLAFAIAVGALMGTALLLRRLPRAPRVEG